MNYKLLAALTTLVMGYAQTMENPSTKRMLENHNPVLERIKIRKTTLSTVCANCDLCGRTFKNNAGLSVHLNSVHDMKRQFKCVLCSLGFIKFAPLELHHKQCHKGEQELRESDFPPLPPIILSNRLTINLTPSQRPAKPALYLIAQKRIKEAKELPFKCTFCNNYAGKKEYHLKLHLTSCPDYKKEIAVAQMLSELRNTLDQPLLPSQHSEQRL